MNISRKVSDIERRILALPVRFGGLGILNPMDTAEIEYDTSIKITTNLKTSFLIRRTLWTDTTKRKSGL